MRTYPPHEMDHIRRRTPEPIKARIDHASARCVAELAERPHLEISEHVAQLDKEWDVNRWGELGCAGLVLLGAAGGRLRIASAAAGAALLWMSLGGGGPVIWLLRRLGRRTRRELDLEKYAAKALRGDFDFVSSEHGPIARAGTACQASLL
jgi:hypothetical protein